MEEEELKDNLMRNLFKHGYPYKTILHNLKKSHGMIMSQRTFYHKLNTLGLGRRNTLNEPDFVRKILSAMN